MLHLDGTKVPFVFVQPESDNNIIYVWDQAHIIKKLMRAIEMYA